MHASIHPSIHPVHPCVSLIGTKRREKTQRIAAVSGCRLSASMFTERDAADVANDDLKLDADADAEGASGYSDEATSPLLLLSASKVWKFQYVTNTVSNRGGKTTC